MGRGQGTSQGQVPAQQLLFGRRTRVAADSPASADPGERVWTQLQRVERDLASGHLDSALHVLRQHPQALAQPGSAPALDLVLDRLVNILIKQMPTNLPRAVTAPSGSAAERPWLSEMAATTLRQELQTHLLTGAALIELFQARALDHPNPGPRTLTAFFAGVDTESYRYAGDNLLACFTTRQAYADRPVFTSALPALIKRLQQPPFWSEPRYQERTVRNILDLVNGSDRDPLLISEVPVSFAKQPPLLHLRDSPSAKRTRCGHEILINWETTSPDYWSSALTRTCTTCAPNGHRLKPRTPRQVGKIVAAIERAQQQALVQLLTEPLADMAALSAALEEHLLEQLTDRITDTLGAGTERREKIWQLMPPAARQTLARPGRLVEIRRTDLRAGLEAYIARWDGYQRQDLDSQRAFRETLGQSLWTRGTKAGKKRRSPTMPPS